MGKSRSQLSLHDRLVEDWEIQNAEDLGEDPDFYKHELQEDEYPDGFED